MPAPPHIRPDPERNYEPARPLFQCRGVILDWTFLRGYAKNPMPGSKTLAYASGVFASEAVVRTWSIQFPWLDRPDFYRSGLPTRTLAASFRGHDPQKVLCKCTKLVDAFLKSMRSSSEARESPGALTKKRSKERT